MRCKNEGENGIIQLLCENERIKNRTTTERKRSMDQLKREKNAVKAVLTKLKNKTQNKLKTSKKSLFPGCYGERVGGLETAKLKVVGTLVVLKRYPPVFSIFFDSTKIYILEGAKPLKLWFPNYAM